MKNIKLILIILSIAFSSCKEENQINTDQVKINVELQHKLESILTKDQGIREIINGNLSVERKAEVLLKLNLNKMDIEGNRKFKLMHEIDSINLVESEEIIKNYGYPSKLLVGEPANKAIYYVIQHSDKIEEYLPLIREATANGDLSKTSLALMEDRNLMNQGLEQIYGTQIKGQANKKGEWIYFLWPIKNFDSVNTWRSQVGFEQNLEEYLKDMDVEFKLYALKDLKNL